jgi:archaeosine-15-forming tRNA-guanine transglycosylase
MRSKKLRKICPSGAFSPEVRASRAFFLVQKVGTRKLEKGIKKRRYRYKVYQKILDI